MGSREFIWGGDILDIVAPVSSCVQGKVLPCLEITVLPSQGS